MQRLYFFKTALQRRRILASPTGIGRAPTRHLLNATPHGVAEVRSPWFLMNGGSKCPLKNHDALLSFSQRWRSALSRLLPLLHLRLAQCMPSRWLGARPRCARRGRNPKATSMIHSHPCYWDEDASLRVLLCPARPQKADVRRERVRNADVYVIRPFGSPLPLQSLHFPRFARRPLQNFGRPME